MKRVSKERAIFENKVVMLLWEKRYSMKEIGYILDRDASWVSVRLSELRKRGEKVSLRRGNEERKREIREDFLKYYGQKYAVTNIAKKYKVDRSLIYQFCKDLY